ncbi:MAG: AraC family transcriptional regulator [Pseudomonadota bacterium]
MSIVSSIGIILTSIALGIGAFGAFCLLARHDLRDRSWPLALLLLSGGVDQLDTLYMLEGGPDHFPALVGLAFPATFLYGPSVYLYLRAMTAPQSPGWDRHAVACLGLPFTVAVATCVVLYTLPLEAKLAILTGGPSETKTPTTAIYLVLLAFFFVTLAIFLFATWRCVVKNLEQTQALFSNIEHRTLSWLRLVFLLMVGAACWAAILEIWRASDAADPWHGVVNALLIILWTFCLVFFGILQRPTLEEAARPIDASAQLDTPSAKYERSGLNDARMTRIADRLQDAMKGEALFRDPDLSLRKLSTKLGITEAHISQTLNEHLGQNFFDFVNAYRVEAAKTALGQGNTPIVEIAFQVGFNARSTFNAAFKKQTGQSPSAFRANL